MQALQDSLTFNGFPTKITGNFDSITVKQLHAFGNSRGINTSSSVVDFETWHLLTSGCNSSKSAAFWIDVGWPQGSVTDEQLQCLLAAGFKFITFECWLEEKGGVFWHPCVDNIFRAQAAGFAVGVYMFPWRAADASIQVSQLLGNLSVRSPFHNIACPPAFARSLVMLQIRLLVCKASSKSCSISRVLLGITRSLRIVITYWRSVLLLNAVD